MKSQKSFTLIELIIVLAIIIVLSGVVAFSVNRYIDISKDNNIMGNLAVLMPTGEVFYGANRNSFYNNDFDFCNPQDNRVLKQIISRMPINQEGPCYDENSDIDNPGGWGADTNTGNPAGVCCYSDTNAWVSYVRKFSDIKDYYCVDSRGIELTLDEISEADLDLIKSKLKCSW